MERQELLEKLEQKREEMKTMPDVETFILEQMVEKGSCEIFMDGELVEKYLIDRYSDLRLIKICEKYNLSYMTPSNIYNYYHILFKYDIE